MLWHKHLHFTVDNPEVTGSNAFSKDTELELEARSSKARSPKIVTLLPWKCSQWAWYQQEQKENKSPWVNVSGMLSQPMLFQGQAGPCNDTELFFYQLLKPDVFIVRLGVEGSPPGTHLADSIRCFGPERITAGQHHRNKQTRRVCLQPVMSQGSKDPGEKARTVSCLLSWPWCRVSGKFCNCSYKGC